MLGTSTSILDDFLIDTTRLSLIRRYRHPFEVDKPVLSEAKKQQILELMRQQKQADQDLGPPPESKVSANDTMDVDSTPPALVAAADESKMDVDPADTAIKTEDAPPLKALSALDVAAAEKEKGSALGYHFSVSGLPRQENYSLSSFVEIIYRFFCFQVSIF